MKKLTTTFAVIALAVAAISLYSCKKLHLFTYDLGLNTYVIVKIPPGDSSGQVLGSSTYYVDIDSVVKGGTGKVYGYKDITSIKLTSATMQLVTFNDSNNFANFQDCIVKLFTSTTTTNSSIYQLQLSDNPDSYSRFVTLPVPTDDLKAYLIGNKFTISGGGNLRRKLTDTIKCQIQLQFNMHVN